MTTITKEDKPVKETVNRKTDVAQTVITTTTKTVDTFVLAIVTMAFTIVCRRPA